MPNTPLLPVADALAQVLAGASRPMDAETVPLANAHNRRLAVDLAAKRTQPPAPLSAMDGYAVRHSDIESVPAHLKLIGTSAAGHGYSGTVGPGQTVRIFTGAPLPSGTDTVVIQEDTEGDSQTICMKQSEPLGRHVRTAGLDFRQGDVLLEKGSRLGPAELALAAAMNHAHVDVVRKPCVAILATGDELVAPGVEPGPDQIVASNNFAVAAYVKRAGGKVLDLGIAKDNFPEIEGAIRRAREAGADVLVTLGGASVGDHDLVQTALKNEGMDLGFWRIAMRPGKPLMHGTIGNMQVLGLPGNPVSAIVCAILFVVPLVKALTGDPAASADMSIAAELGEAMRENDTRQDYVRARVSGLNNGKPVATPFSRQDSSMLGTLAQSQALIIRPPFAKAAQKGDPCRIIMLDTQA
jgi:molybdopterin molybdotransferase